MRRVDRQVRLVDYAAIEEDAGATRSRLGIREEDPLPDIASVVARLADCGLAIWPLGAAGPDGSYLRQGRLKLIVLNSNKYYPRFRFTAAHHIAHAHYDDHVHLDVDRRADRVPEEVRANAFAARFLVPARALQAGIGSSRPTPRRVLELSLRFGTSYEFMVNRLNNVGIISNWLRGELSRKRRVVLTEDLRHRMPGEQKVLSGIVDQPALDAYQVPDLVFRHLGTLLRMHPADQAGSGAGIVRSDCALQELDSPGQRPLGGS